MKRSTNFVLISVCCFLSTVLLGCATVKEAAKGFVGVSTQVLEETRKDALRKSFAVDYDSCYAKVKDILREKVNVKVKEKESENGSYIYAEDTKKKMLGIYLSEIDTTPVGIFFTEEGKGHTMVEISSPSTYAKEYMAKRIFNGIETAFKLKSDPEVRGLISDNQSQEEKKSDVK